MFEILGHLPYPQDKFLLRKRKTKFLAIPYLYSYIFIVFILKTINYLVGEVLWLTEIILLS